MKKNEDIMTSSKNIHIVIGTKAQLIKMAPIMYFLEKKSISYNFIFTGQHQETINNLRENFNIKKPDIVLHQGKDITGILQMFFWGTKILYKIIFKRKQTLGEKNKNDILLTHGDTFTTVIGALMGKFGRIKVAHIESGLRSFRLFNPFPEELNRIFTFYLSNYYFCPGEYAVNNLKKFKGKKINTKINTLYDSLHLIKQKFKQSNIQIPQQKYCIISIHRFENIFNKKQFTKIIKIIKSLPSAIKILFILHPPTKKQLIKFGFIEELKNSKNIELRPRYNYLNFIKLLSESEFLISDGGSNQEECYYLGKPCLLLRKTSERKEGLDKNVVISNFNDKIINNFLKNYKKYTIKELENVESPTEIIIDKLNFL